MEPLPPPKKKGRWVTRIAVVAAVGGATFVVVRRLLGRQESPWQTARPSTPYSPTTTTSATAAPAADTRADEAAGDDPQGGLSAHDVYRAADGAAEPDQPAEGGTDEAVEVETTDVVVEAGAAGTGSAGSDEATTATAGAPANAGYSEPGGAEEIEAAGPPPADVATDEPTSERQYASALVSDTGPTSDSGAEGVLGAGDPDSVGLTTSEVGSSDRGHGEEPVSEELGSTAPHDTAVGGESPVSTEDDNAAGIGPDAHPQRWEGEGVYVGVEPPEGFTIKGNERSMKYHVPESAGYGRTIAEVWFSSEEAAQRNGFVKAQR